MPTKDTKTITIRISKGEYYQWLKLASENEQPISTYVKSCLDINKAPVQKSNSFKSPKKRLVAYRMQTPGRTASIVFFPSEENPLFQGFWLQKYNTVDFTYLCKKIDDFGISKKAVFQEDGKFKFYSASSTSNSGWEEMDEVEQVVLYESDIKEYQMIGDKLITFKISIDRI